MLHEELPIATLCTALIVQIRELCLLDVKLSWSTLYESLYYVPLKTLSQRIYFTTDTSLLVKYFILSLRREQKEHYQLLHLHAWCYLIMGARHSNGTAAFPQAGLNLEAERHQGAATSTTHTASPPRWTEKKSYW